MESLQNKDELLLEDDYINLYKQDTQHHQESVNSYNTADFTKFSIAELSQSNQKNQLIKESRIKHRLDSLEDGLSLALRIILKLAE